MSVERIEVEADPETIAAWQAHFAEPDEIDLTWLTCGELANLAGITPRVMRERMRVGVLSGKYDRQMAYRKRPTDGMWCKVPVYKLIEQLKKETKGRHK